MTSNPSETAVVRKNRIILILTFAAFILPALLAYLAHVTGFWQTRGTVNQGILVTPPVDFDQIALKTENDGEVIVFDRGQQWWIAYLVPQNCEAACKNSLLEARQTQTATGPYQKRVSTLLIQHERSDPAAAQWARDNAPSMVIARVAQSQWRQHLTHLAIEKASDIANAGQIYLIDPMGAVFMTYPGQSDPQEAIKQGKGMLKDLQRVLKLSKIG